MIEKKIIKLKALKISNYQNTKKIFRNRKNI